MTVTVNTGLPRVSLFTSLLIVGLFVVGALLARVLDPKPSEVPLEQPLAVAVPASFGDWKEVPSPFVAVSAELRREGTQQSAVETYDDLLSRTYQDSNGNRIMLSLAYGRNQRQEQKIHRPELCYVAQGFQVLELGDTQMPVLAVESGHPIDGKRMLASTAGRLEAVSYWIRIGEIYSSSALKSRLHILQEGLAGRVPDGILVRASMIVEDKRKAQAAYPMMEEFLYQLVSATPLAARRLLVR